MPPISYDILVLSSFYRRVNWGIERLTYLVKWWLDLNPSPPENKASELKILGDLIKSLSYLPT